MTSLFLLVSMTTGRYAARPRFCLGAFFASDTTILRKLAIHSDNQAKEKNGHFQNLTYFCGFISLKIIPFSLLSTGTMTCPFKILLFGIFSTLMRASDVELPLKLDRAVGVLSQSINIGEILGKFLNLSDPHVLIHKIGVVIESFPIKLLWVKWDNAHKVSSSLFGTSNTP